MSKITITKSEATAIVDTASNRKEAITMLCEAYKLNKSNAGKILSKLDVKFGRQTVEFTDDTQVLETSHI
jgi:putative IMPACT (imprinted ancient) family translation regulator